MSKMVKKHSHVFTVVVHSRMDKALYNLYTLWLFPRSDLKTVVIPSTAFSLFMSFALSRASNPFFDHPLPLSETWLRIPAMLCWAWTCALNFGINNQRTDSAIKEDTLNKPWRPLPSGRISRQNAQILGHVAPILTLVASLMLGGGFGPAAFLVLLGYLYNQVHLGDRSCITKNLLNALGISSFAGGALEVMQQGPLVRGELAWLGVVAAVILTTIHIQDMYDQPGDAAIKRKTVPLVIGDTPSRWTIAMGTMLWSVLCPLFWDVGLLGHLLVMALGSITTYRTMSKRTVKQDRKTFMIYNIWLMSLYSLPTWSCWA